MIIKFNDYIKESLLDKLEGPTKEEVWKHYGYDITFNTPEEFFLDVINGIKIKPQTKYSQSVFWEKNGKILFEQDFKNNMLYVDYKYIWVIFEKIFSLQNAEIQRFLKNGVDENLNWKGLTPAKAGIPQNQTVDENLNWKGLTPLNSNLNYFYWRKNI